MLYHKIIIYNFAPLKRIRKISPIVSVLLALLIIAGSSGYTYVIHTCHHCMVEKLMTSYDTESHSACGCCEGLNESVSDNTGDNQGYTLRQHCCNHRLERLMTSELVKTEAQTEIMPFFIASAIINVLPSRYTSLNPLLPLPDNLSDGRQLTTLHCQIRA